MGDWPNRFKDLSDVAQTSGGAPTTGSWNANDIAVDSAGVVWICTVAGTPGTWASVGTTELGHAQITTVPTGNGTTQADVPGLAVTFTAPSRPVMIYVYAYSVQQAGSTGTPLLSITDSSNNPQQYWTPGAAVAAGAFAPSPNISVRIPAGVLTPGSSYTYKLRSSTTAGTVAVGGNAQWPAFIRVEQK